MPFCTSASCAFTGTNRSLQPQKFTAGRGFYAECGAGCTCTEHNSNTARCNTDLDSLSTYLEAVELQVGFYNVLLTCDKMTLGKTACETPFNATIESITAVLNSGTSSSNTKSNIPSRGCGVQCSHVQQRSHFHVAYLSYHNFDVKKTRRILTLGFPVSKENCGLAFCDEMRRVRSTQDHDHRQYREHRRAR